MLTLLNVSLGSDNCAPNPAAELKNLLSSFKTLSANFSQKIKSDTGDIIQTTTGNVFIKRPGKFYWQAQQPIKQLIIINNNKSYLYEPDLEQVTIRDTDDNLSQTPAMLLTNSNDALLKKFDISIESKRANHISFLLKPKNKSLQTVKNIIITFTGNKINSLVFTNQLEQTVLVNFINIKINLSIQDDKFIFVVPKNTEVITQ